MVRGVLWAERRGRCRRGLKFKFLRYYYILRTVYTVMVGTIRFNYSYRSGSVFLRDCQVIIIIAVPCPVAATRYVK